MPNWCENNMKITGAADEIARFKQTCIVADDDGKPDFDFNTIVPMPEVLKGSEASGDVDHGLLLIGRNDLVRFGKSFTEMLDWPWVKEANIKTVEELKTVLIERHPDAVSKAQQAIALHEQTGFLNWYDWQIANWGTKWGACITTDDANTFECSFGTAWNPPVPVWKKLGEMFPTLTFELSGEEPNMDFAFRGTIHDGRLELRDVPIVWSAIDPKTGETISGSPDELEAALGEDWHQDASYEAGA